MSQDSLIIVELKEENDMDVLEFKFTNPIKISLNNSTNSELKKVFEVMLKELINNDFKLDFKIANDYKKKLYMDVCDEYIKALNEEIEETIASDLWKEIFES